MRRARPGGLVTREDGDGSCVNVDRKAVPGTGKGTETMVALVSWHIWLERNSCTFRSKLPSVKDVVDASRRDMEQWRIASAKFIVTLLGI